jgi:tripartite-type tricarboxylate transporter receptor subunit TctC
MRVSAKTRSRRFGSPARPSSVFPDLRSSARIRFPDLVVEDWVGFAVKSGTSNEVIARQNVAINKALATPRVREAFAKLGAEPAGGTPESYGQLVSSQLAHWAKVVEASGMKLQQ